jgi:hypothetical protein
MSKGNSNVITSFVKTMASLDDLDLSLKPDHVDTPAIISTKINKLTLALNSINEAGKGMDDLSLFPVPIDMLEFLDGDISNPELYQFKTFEENEDRAKKLSERLLYLQTLRKKSTEVLK